MPLLKFHLGDLDLLNLPSKTTCLLLWRSFNTFAIYLLVNRALLSQEIYFKKPYVFRVLNSISVFRDILGWVYKSLMLGAKNRNTLAQVVVLYIADEIIGQEKETRMVSKI